MPVWAACGGRCTLDSGRFRGSSSRLLFRLLLTAARVKGPGVPTVCFLADAGWDRSYASSCGLSES
jgi:hypothetical protein